MNIVTFNDISEHYMIGHNVCFYTNKCENKSADVAILDINSIFDFEEHKLSLCKANFSSIAIIDEDDDFDAFKNFGITAWIKREDLDQMSDLLLEIQQKMKI